MTFYNKKDYSLVIVEADTPEEALEIFQRYEKESMGELYASAHLKPEDMKPIPKEKGVVAYMAD